MRKTTETWEKIGHRINEDGRVTDWAADACMGDFAFAPSVPEGEQEWIGDGWVYDASGSIDLDNNIGSIGSDWEWFDLAEGDEGPGEHCLCYLLNVCEDLRRQYPCLDWYVFAHVDDQDYDGVDLDDFYADLRARQLTDRKLPEKHEPCRQLVDLYA